MSGTSRKVDGKSDGRLGAPTPTSGRRLKSVAKEKQDLPINVGIDFGTSSTKVIFTDRYFMPKHVCAFPDNPEGYPPVCLPSAVRVADGRVYFGDEAERRTGGVVYRSFKMCMTCNPADGICQSCPNPLGETRRSGLFRIQPDGSDFVTAEEVSAWYLGHVANLARIHVEKQYPGVTTRLTYQTAAPLKSCEASAEKRAFEEAIHIASRIAPGVQQGIRLSELRQLYAEQRSLLEDDGLPHESERNTCVIPETHAAVIGFVRSPRSENGLYAIVDVGAGTSDISFLRLFLDNNVLSYYSSEVTTIGGDALDREILRCIFSGAAAGDPAGELEFLARIRTAKHSEGPVDLDQGIRVDRKTCLGAASKIARTIFADYERTWVRAYQKEERRSAWERYTLYLCGGGSRLRPAFPNEFRKCPKPQSHVVGCVEVRQFEIPDGLESVDGDADGLHEHGYLLLVAYGVAFHRPRIPDWIVSSLVRPLEKNPEPVQVTNWDDYGKDGHWW